MHPEPMFRGQFRRQFVNRQIGVRRDPGAHPFLEIVQFAASGIPLWLRFQASGLALEPHHIVDELDRNAQTPGRLRVRVSLFDKRDRPFSQLNRMRFAHL